MISCRLQGGLGNQMFQIAAAAALAMENDDEFGFDFDSCYTPLQGNPSNKYLKTFFKYIPNSNNFPFTKYFKEKSHRYEKIPYERNLILNGYFQSEKYFQKSSSRIKGLFYIPNCSYVCSQNATAIHVRRGDYLKNPNIHPVCSLDYYKNAMEIIGKDSQFVFISDDMDWVKQNFKGSNILYSQFTDEINDFVLLTGCRNNIISNSTYSWWAAYLNDTGETNFYGNKTVIAPKIWFGPDGPDDTDVVPENWIKL